MLTILCFNDSCRLDDVFNLTFLDRNRFFFLSFLKISMQVLNSFYDAVSITLRENVEKAALFDCFGQILLIVDELVDGGIIMQTDAQELAKAGEVTSSKDGAPLSEKSVAQAMSSASNFLKRTILA